MASCLATALGTLQPSLALILLYQQVRPLEKWGQEWGRYIYPSDSNIQIWTLPLPLVPREQPEVQQPPTLLEKSVTSQLHSITPCYLLAYTLFHLIPTGKGWMRWAVITPASEKTNEVPSERSFCPHPTAGHRRGGTHSQLSLPDS